MFPPKMGKIFFSTANKPVLQLDNRKFTKNRPFEKVDKNILTLLLCSALCYSLSDVYSKLSKNYEIIIELENRHENTKQLFFERQEHLANEFESVQKKIFDLEKSMLEDVKHIIAELKEKQINNQFQIDEIDIDMLPPDLIAILCDSFFHLLLKI